QLGDHRAVQGVQPDLDGSAGIFLLGRVPDLNASGLAGEVHTAVLDPCARFYAADVVAVVDDGTVFAVEVLRLNLFKAVARFMLHHLQTGLQPGDHLAKLFRGGVVVTGQGRGILDSFRNLGAIHRVEAGQV